MSWASIEHTSNQGNTCLVNQSSSYPIMTTSQDNIFSIVIKWIENFMDIVKTIFKFKLRWIGILHLCILSSNYCKGVFFLAKKVQLENL